MIGASSDVVWSSTAVAVWMALVVRLLVPPRRSLADRVRPYAGLMGTRLGTGYSAAAVRHAVGRDAKTAVGGFGGLLETLSRRLSALIDRGDDETLALRLRQAGFADIGPPQYRMRQLVLTTMGILTGAALGAGLLGSVGGALLLMVCFGLPASVMQRNRVQRAIDARRSIMRSEVYTVAQLLAVHLRTGRGPVEAVRSVTGRGRGPVVAELREGLTWVAGGVPPADAYRRLSEVTPEPAVARLYRLLGASANSGGEVGAALLALADDLRSSTREDLERRSVRRRTAMLVPLLLLIAPVMLWFVAAAIPFLLFG